MGRLRPFGEQKQDVTWEGKNHVNSEQLFKSMAVNKKKPISLDGCCVK